MTEEEFKRRVDAIPERFRDRVGYGLYGGEVEYFVIGVDGTVAVIGQELPESHDEIAERIAYADKSHRRLIRGRK